MSLIGCSAWDVAEILRKQRQPLTGMQVFADCEQDDEPPWRFRAIRVRYVLTGENLDPDRVKGAIELSESKYCSVYATLKDCVNIVSEFAILDK
jgi:putative redox protein